MRRMSMAKSGNDIRCSVEIVEPPPFVRQRHRKISAALLLSAATSLAGGGGVEERPAEEPEEEEVPRVNFQLPANRRPSICHQTSQPTLRERVKGSPRFPHRILPTSSLNALVERDSDGVAVIGGE